MNAYNANTNARPVRMHKTVLPALKVFTRKEETVWLAHQPAVSVTMLIPANSVLTDTSRNSELKVMSMFLPCLTMFVSPVQKDAEHA